MMESMRALKTKVWVKASILAAHAVGNETTKQFLTLTPPEQSAYLQYLVQLNVNHQDGGISQSDENRLNFGSFSKIIRKHFQLPCCPMTQRKRVEWLRSNGSLSRKVLFLGDDDLVSACLAKEGFENVWVVDCDVKVLKTIDFLCRELVKPPRTRYSDLASPRFTPPCEADTVCIDPPYNFKWLRIFVHAAIKSTGNRDDTEIVLMFNPKCIKDFELKSVIAELEEHGYVLETHIPFFNRYPLNVLSRTLLWAACFLLIRTKINTRIANIGFGSDMFVFKRRDLKITEIVKTSNEQQTVT